MLKIINKWRNKYNSQINGYFFILPSFFLISIFGIFPIFYSLFISLHKWRVKKVEFRGFANYEKLLGDPLYALIFFIGLCLIILSYWIWKDSFKKISNRIFIKISSIIIILIGFYLVDVGWNQMMQTGDDRYLNSLIHSAYYSFFVVSIEIILGLLIAYALFQKIKGKQFFQMFIFMPYITPAVMASTVFLIIFSNRETSLANNIIHFFGGSPQQFLADTRTLSEILFGLKLEGFWAGPSVAMMTVIFFGIWNHTGYYAVILLAGLGGIPKNLYEAAAIDGAGTIYMFKKITIPLLSPIIFFLAVSGFILSFQAFNHIYVLRTPLAGETLDVVSISIFDSFYGRNKFGYASAQAICLFCLIILLTVSQFLFFRKKIHYE